MNNNSLFPLKCIVCLESTDFINPRNGLPFCCDRHSDLYTNRKLVGRGYVNSNNNDADNIDEDNEKRFEDMRQVFQVILDNYIHAENQDALWDGKEYLNLLARVVEFEITSVVNQRVNYITYKKELSILQLHADDYGKVRENILFVLSIIIRDLILVQKNLVKLEEAITREKRLLVDRVY